MVPRSGGVSRCLTPVLFHAKKDSNESLCVKNGDRSDRKSVATPSRRITQKHANSLIAKCLYPIIGCRFSIMLRRGIVESILADAAAESVPRVLGSLRAGEPCRETHQNKHSPWRGTRMKGAITLASSARKPFGRTM